MGTSIYLFCFFSPSFIHGILCHHSFNRVHESGKHHQYPRFKPFFYYSTFYKNIVANANLFCCLGAKYASGLINNKTWSFINIYVKFVMSEQASHKHLQDK